MVIERKAAGEERHAALRGVESSMDRLRGGKRTMKDRSRQARRGVEAGGSRSRRGWLGKEPHENRPC